MSVLCHNFDVFSSSQNHLSFTRSADEHSSLLVWSHGNVLVSMSACLLVLSAYL